MDTNIVLSMGENDYRGFLTPTQREYLRGEKSLEDYSNPAQFKKRIRDRYRGAQMDAALLEQSPVVDNEELQKSLRVGGNTYAADEIDSDALEFTEQSGLAQAHAVMGESVDPLYDTMEYVASERVQQERQFKETIVDAVERLLIGIAGIEREKISGWIQQYWPSKEFAIKHIERKQSD